MKNYFSNISIKLKIFLYLIGFCGVLLVILIFFQMVFLDDFYKYVKTTEIKNISNVIEKNIDDENLSTEIKNLLQKYETFGDIVDKNGNKIYYTDGSIENKSITKKINDNKLFEITKKHNGEYTQEIKTNMHLGIQSFGNLKANNWQLPKNKNPNIDSGKKLISDGNGKMLMQKSVKSIIYSRIVKNSKGDEVLMILTSEISPVDATIDTLRFQLIVVSGIMLIFSILLAFLISRNVSKPIININDNAKLLAKGNYDIKFNANGFREISELSDTMNFAANELSKVESLRREFIANVSHDLRTPLTLISGYAEVMRDLPEENTPENAQVIIDETQRLTSLVTDILEISKIESNNDILNLQDYNLTKSVEKVINRLGEFLKNNGYKIEFDFDEEVLVNGDEKRISQVFYNFLTNAINYAGSDKRIIITQSVQNESVKISVRDFGVGIDEKDLPYIWERYYKSDKNHVRAVTGSGLGLSIVKSIINYHGGKFGAQSVVGEGSTFWFSLEIKRVV